MFSNIKFGDSQKKSNIKILNVCVKKVIQNLLFTNSYNKYYYYIK